MDSSCIRQLSSTGRVTCALDAAGEVWGWGYNASGQMADGATTNHSTPVRASFGPAIAVDAGSALVCALRAHHTLWCAGANESGQLGDGTTRNRRVGVQVLLEDALDCATA